MSSRTSTRRKRAAISAYNDENSPSPRPRRERSPSIVFLYIRKSAPPPFNADSANLILHTPAGTPFRLNRQTIRNASPVLDAEITQSEDAYRALTPSDFVLEALLRFIYFEEPVLLDLDDIVDVLQAATKYKIRVAIQGLTKALRLPRFLDKDPLRVFSIFNRFQLEDADAAFKRAVLKHSVQWPPTNHDPEQDMSLEELYGVVKYRRQMAFSAISLIEDPTRLCLPWDRIPGGKPPCGGTCWWPVPAFIASIGMELKCVDCRERLLCVLLPSGFIEQLRHDIDALPDTPYYYW
ncbi:hypothetical protein K466DRAFT_605138 [Polyporus arcularius HHB13444]|uniref:BTB domain-containing protein n=1 Tax=Polyporus arcularius HHB13444 TaxID=1314778 RepID=A0A5C3NT42_9APHY|nr:hypothetical protein K466DRAFT_605138 [Polyporus arcularius HHB13444]